LNTPSYAHLSTVIYKRITNTWRKFNVTIQLRYRPKSKPLLEWWRM